MRKLIALVMFAFVALTGTALADGAADFKAKCVMCHGADGAGNTPMGKKLGIRDLRSDETKKLTDAQLITITTAGKNKMPSFKDKLSHDQITALVAYIRDLQQKK